MRKGGSLFHSDGLLLKVAGKRRLYYVLIGSALIASLCPSVSDADTLVAVTDPADALASAPVATNAYQAVAFSLDRAPAFHNVSITVWLGPDQTTTPVVVYLTNRIGPGTTTADLIGVQALTPNIYSNTRTASSFDGFGPDVAFSGLKLPPGSYYLTLVGTVPQASTGETDWSAGASTVETRYGQLIDGQLAATAGNGASLDYTFPPSSRFIDTVPITRSTDLNPFAGLIFSVDATRVPEPSNAGMMILGFAMLLCAGMLFSRFES